MLNIRDNATVTEFVLIRQIEIDRLSTCYWLGCLGGILNSFQAIRGQSTETEIIFILFMFIAT